MDAKKAMKALVSRVNNDLWCYESGWVSVQRYPNAEKSRPDNLKDYVEARFNFEASRIPEIEDTLLKTEGRLFSCIELREPDEEHRRYKQATLKIIEEEDVPDEFPEVKEGITKIKQYLGGNTIRFNSVKRKIKITITNENKENEYK